MFVRLNLKEAIGYIWKSSLSGVVQWKLLGEWSSELKVRKHKQLGQIYSTASSSEEGKR